MLSFFPRDVLGEICDLIGLVSEGFPTYFCIGGHSREASKLEFNARDTPRYSATVQSAYQRALPGSSLEKLEKVYLTTVHSSALG